MNGPRINNDDRGITLNKPLAWTIGCTLVGAGLWVGVQVSTLTTVVSSLADGMDTARNERNALDQRLRSLENRSARDEQRYSDMLRILSRIEQRLEDLATGRTQAK